MHGKSIGVLSSIYGYFGDKTEMRARIKIPTYQDTKDTWLRNVILQPAGP